MIWHLEVDETQEGNIKNDDRVFKSFFFFLVPRFFKSLLNYQNDETVKVCNPVLWM